MGRSNTGTTASGATATRPLQRQNSFDRGDDDVIISPIGRAATWQLPPTPSELEQRERMGSVPQIRLQQSQPPPPPTAYPPQIHGEAPQTRGQGVPIIQVPTTGQPAAGTLTGKAATSTTTDQRSQIQSDLRRDETPSPIQARVSVPATPANESTPQLYGSREHVPAPVPPTNESTSQSYGSRERVPPPFGVGPTTQPPAAPISAEDKHLPQVLNEVRSQEGEGSPGPTTPALSQPQEVEGTAPPLHEQTPDVHKPTPPLPLLEDTCLETISEHDSVVSGPSSPTNVMAPTRNIPSYASNYSGEGYEISQSSPHYEESTVPLYIPSLPSAKQQPVSSSPPPPASTAAKSRITRPADIYKRHQENLKQQHTSDSSRTNSDSTARPSIDVQNSPPSIDAARPPTRESMHNQSQVSDPTTLPQQHSRASSEDLREPSRDSSRPSSRQERGQIASQISQDDPSRPDSRSGGITITTEQSSHLPEGHPPAAPASPFVPEDPPNAKTSETPSWGEDIISGYTTSAMDTTTSNKSDYFTPPTGQSRVASSTSVPQISASPQQETAVSRGFQTMVDTAFIRQDSLLPTPLSDSSTPKEALSPILPPPPVPPKEEGGKWRASYQRNTLTPTQDDPSRELQQLSPTPDNKRAPSPDAWREGARRSSTPVVLPPVLTESVSGIMDEATPIDTREKDDLDTLIVQLERAQTPVPPSPDIPKQTSDAHPQTGCDHLDAFQNSSNPRESMGVFSIYGEYWEDGDEAPASLAPASLAPASPTPPPIQPKSPLRGVRSIEGPISTQQIPSAQPGAPKGRSPSPPPAVSIPVAPKNAEEPATPASSVDEELIEMASAGNRFLDRRGTGFSVSSSKDRAESRPQLSSVTESENKTPLQLPVIKPDSEGIQVIPPVKQLGPESEGIEAITGPTVEKRPKSKEDENTPVESEYAKELVSQFSRPQTLMLKDTMPMPTGMLVMPSMPPLPGKEAGEVAPEVVNFDKDDAEGLEATEPDGPGLEAAHHHEDGLQVSLLAPPLGDNQPRSEPAGTNNRTVNQRAVLQDTKTIAALITPVERTKAYDALRWQVAESPDPLSEWIAHQMEHNNGEQLLKAEVVTIKSELSVKKSRSKIGLGHFPSRSGDHHHYEDGSALRAEEKLSQMGRGARKLGEKAGEKVGGWMKRVGKKV